MMVGNEELFVNEVELFLNSLGIQTYREVVPDQCSNWSKPYRIDLIFYLEDKGYIAVEFKDFNTLGQGAAFMKAVEQIKKYQELTFFDGQIINRWCLCINHNTRENHTLNEFCKNIVNYFNIGWMEFIKYSSGFKRIAIDTNKGGAIHIKKGYDSWY